MLREIKTDRSADCVERVGSGNQQELHLDSTIEAPRWKKVSPNNKVMRNLEDLSKMLGHAVHEKTKKIEKQIKTMKKRF